MTPTESDRRTAPSWTAPVALVIAVLAVALAGWAVLRSPGQSAEDPGAATSKADLCGSVNIVRSAVSRQTNADLGADPIAREAVAANARLATLGGGSFLIARLGPGVPSELADAVRSFADNLQEIGMKQLAGTPNADPALTEQLKAAQSTSDHIGELCK